MWRHLGAWRSRIVSALGAVTGLNQSHEANHLATGPHLPRPDTDMDNIRSSFSGLKKKIRHKVTRSKRKQDGIESDALGERVDSPGSLLLPGSHVVVGGSHDGGGNRADTDGPQVDSIDLPSQPDEPEPVPGHEEADVGATPAGSGPIQGGNDTDGQKVERISTPLPTVSISHSGAPGGMCRWSLWALALIIPSDSVDTSAAPGHVQAVPRPDGSTERGAAADENKSTWGSTALATAKLLLRGVRDSADAFGPLKSVAGGLCFILENHEVRLSPKYTIRDAYTSP